MVLFTRQKYLSKQLDTREAMMTKQMRTEGALVHQPAFSQEQSIRKPGVILMCLNCLKYLFLHSFGNKLSIHLISH